MLKISESELQEMVVQMTMSNMEALKNKLLKVEVAEERSAETYQPTFDEVAADTVMTAEVEAVLNAAEEEAPLVEDGGQKWESTPLPEGLREMRSIMAPEKLREQMRHRMIVLNMNQKEYAEGSGVAPTTISGIMCGRSETTARKLFLLTEFLDLGDECLSVLKKEYKKRHGRKWEAPRKIKTSVQASLPNEVLESPVVEEKASSNIGAKTDMSKLYSKRHALFNLKHVNLKLSPEMRDLLKHAYNQKNAHDQSVLSIMPDHLIEKKVENRVIKRSINAEAISRFLTGESWITLEELRVICKFLNRTDLLGDLKKDVHQINF
jgi:transcriptional regulator with XRE-family HTH domain